MIDTAMSRENQVSADLDDEQRVAGSPIASSMRPTVRVVLVFVVLVPVRILAHVVAELHVTHLFITHESGIRVRCP